MPKVLGSSITICMIVDSVDITMTGQQLFGSRIILFTTSLLFPELVEKLQEYMRMEAGMSIT
jgi:hypothetical protein